MRTAVKEAGARGRERVWRCPKCGRTFRHHVFSHATPASGPMCNACCVELEWAEVEVEERAEVAVHR